MKLDLQNGFSTMLGLNSSAAILTTEGGSHDLNNEGGLFFGFWLLYHHCNSPTESPCWCFDPKRIPVEHCMDWSLARHSEAFGHFWSVCASECSIYGWKLAAMSQRCCLRPSVRSRLSFSSIIQNDCRRGKDTIRGFVETVKISWNLHVHRIFLLYSGFLTHLLNSQRFCKFLAGGTDRFLSQRSWDARAHLQLGPRSFARAAELNWHLLVPVSPKV